MNINAEFNVSSEINQIQLKIRGYLQQHWKWLFVEGVFLIIMGSAAIIVPNVFTLGIILFLGWLLIISGILQMVRVFTTSHLPGARLWIFSAIIQIIIGYFFVTDPLDGRMTLAVLLGLYFAMDGMAKIYLALMFRPLASWGWLIFSGIASLLMLIIVWAGWPGTALWVPGLLLGINLIFTGWSLLSISLQHKSV
ncbi:DUF308 domain-containing protein [Methylomonas sp. AM2-LC]|uniref:HdeD family acid-resistance protein n=1 Tax=Methylomonas sp. AM2-LC TaxID=3153301 RepID=UPI003266276D